MCCLKSRENWFSNICHSSEWQDYTNPFSQNSRSNIDFFLQANWVFKLFFNLHMEKKVRIHGQIYCPNSNFKCQLACSGPNHTSKRPICTIYLTKCCLYQTYFNFGCHVCWCGQWDSPDNRVSTWYILDIYMMTFTFGN